MVKLIIFFRQPADPQAFEDHFAHRHVPLIAAMPGVVRTSVSRALGAPRGAPPYYLVHDVYFADMAALNYALNSAQGRAAGADLMMFARDIVSLMFAEVWGEDPFEMGAAAQTATSATTQGEAPPTRKPTTSGAEANPVAIVEEHPSPIIGDQPPAPAAGAPTHDSPNAAPLTAREDNPA
ncbi:MAG: EthD family reductase [Anaerolineae bacterium]|nr:EthD family reductase [Candidatus Roseilinea sp.]MDW8449966.1 EthD family reductase [Anaerolineae bacterium]